MKRDYDEVLSEYGVAAYDENASNNKTVIAEREKFEKWLNTLDKQTLVTMAAKQAKTIEELQAATKASSPEDQGLLSNVNRGRVSRPPR